MATILNISLQEYMATNYRPDREYLDGEVRERNVGKWEHARLQWLLACWFGAHESEWGIVGSMEQRLQVSPRKVRIPDVVVLAAGPQPAVITDPPLLIIEILSPEDTYSDTEERVRDYRALEVETIWIIDPKTRTGRMCVGESWSESQRLEVKGTPLFVDLPSLFSQVVSAQS